ncbi:tetratricopeptide repeat protein [Algicella marina]|uniref:Tetratricopeptide repeat protein n=1 Tax=Algicella marina TaxID=2683284 RepID=A0A6P1T6V8_9RHOB|nr:tetratricopeptide repeat protein [Algicella marina]QHQ37226.1 tetratricopeptide repeat protein [Algicella marina]
MGCARDPDVLINDRVGLPAPRNLPTAQAPDGLEIGHRLMDAGEYELALKAYYRAASDLGFTADVLSAIGSANLRLQRLGQAETTLRAALELDEKFVPALNNLGVVLNARNQIGEARELFRVAYALDNGSSDDIRDNLRLLDDKLQNIDTETAPIEDFRLVRRGNGQYLLLGQ